MYLETPNFPVVATSKKSKTAWRHARSIGEDDVTDKAVSSVPRSKGMQIAKSNFKLGHIENFSLYPTVPLKD